MFEIFFLSMLTLVAELNECLQYLLIVCERDTRGHSATMQLCV